MVLTKTLLVAAAIASGLLASPSATATSTRIPKPQPRPVQPVQPSATVSGLIAALAQAHVWER